MTQFFITLFVLLAVQASAQRVAVLTPDNVPTSVSFADSLGEKLGEKLKMLDSSLAESAFHSFAPLTPFNLTSDESKRIGSAIGCDAFIELRSETQRRSAFGRPEYYESFAAIYVVSSRTGRLAYWKLQQFEAAKPDASEKLLTDSLPSLAVELTDRIKTILQNELSEMSAATLEEVPDENSFAAKNFRAPVPYRRLKPDYTAQASLYSVSATVEVMVDLDAAGNIMRTEVVRWAGYGLDESAVKNIRSMNWRPAERNGKPLPMRFLVRYNFKKLDKDQK